MTEPNSAGPPRLLRHRLARPWLAAHRAWSNVRKAPAGMRFLILHETAPSVLPTLEEMAVGLQAATRLWAPADVEAWLAAPHRVMVTMPCVLTFDDGFHSNLEAARCLARHGIRALFFICPGLMEMDADTQQRAIARKMFDNRVGADALAAGRRLLTWPEVEEMIDLGHTVGAHGMTHRRLTTLAGDELEAEIGDCKSAIQQRLGFEPDWYAYSFGDIDSISGEALAMIGRHYAYCRSGVRGINIAATSPRALRADEIDLSAPTAYRQLVSEGGLDFRYRKARRRLDRLTMGAQEEYRI